MVLVDTSVWIEYFKGSSISLPLNTLIDYNNICINDLILAELIPSIAHKHENDLKDILYNIYKLNIDIQWNEIIQMQTLNFKNGINKVGIGDLIIAQNAIIHDIEIYAIDKHFGLMSKVHPIKIYNP